MYQFLKYEKEKGVVRLSMNRPEVYNAFNNELTYELQDAFKQIKRDDGVRVVVLTGEGKAFGSGQDLKASQADPNRSFLDSVRKRYNPLIRAMRELPKPIICRLNGVAAGAACSIALACDIIVAAEQATLIEVFINIGLVPDSGSSYFIPKTLTPARAFELCTMGSRLSAQQACDWGMINKVVPLEQLDSAVQEYVDYYAAAPTKAIGMIKKMLNKAQTASLDEMLEYEAFCQEIVGNTADHKEGVKAFLEKRKPQYLGR
jgi:2-(1,2-epoxy-1,2-dihydrophenyl)acetyl-CoA isomerase